MVFQVGFSFSSEAAVELVLWMNLVLKNAVASSGFDLLL